MKQIKQIAGIMLVIALLTSCVSSKRYNELMSAKQNSDKELKINNEDYKSLQAERDKLNSEVKKLKETSAAEAAELSADQKKLDEKEKALADLKELISQERQAIQSLKQEVCFALKCFTPDELTIEVRDGKLYVSMSDKLLFPSGSDVVNARGKEAVTMLAAVLSNSTMEIMVEGHTDNIPISNERNRDNWDLSAHRATSVARIMIENGIKPERLISSRRGEFHPLAGNETAEGRQKNRRTEIVLAPKLDKLWKLTEGGDDNASSSVK